MLTDTKRWAVGVRVGMLFARMGCEVGMLCPSKGHPAYTVESIRRRYVHRGLFPLKSLRAAMADFDPHLVLPTCDRGVQQLHRLYEEAKDKGHRRTMECIRRSLGPSASFSIVSDRYDLLMLAAEEGIAIPETVALESVKDLQRAGRIGLPLVIKATGTWGGTGVEIAASEAQAVRAFRKLMGRRGPLWLAKELLLNRDRGNTLHDWRHAQPSLIAQRWIDGHPANCAVACVDGKVLATVAVEVLATNRNCGPASLVEVVPGREMVAAAGRIARKLNLSGFFGLDFMIERATGALYLIEMNPRCTQAAMLALGTGHNLPMAMCASLTGRQEPESEPVTQLRRIAFFPKPPGLADSDTSTPERSYYYDLPANEPAFVARMLDQWPDRGRLGRGLDWTRRFAKGLRAGRLHPAEQR